MPTQSKKFIAAANNRQLKINKKNSEKTIEMLKRLIIILERKTLL